MASGSSKFDRLPANPLTDAGCTRASSLHQAVLTARDGQFYVNCPNNTTMGKIIDFNIAKLGSQSIGVKHLQSLS